MFGYRLKVPAAHRARLSELAQANGFKGADAFARHLVDRGLTRLGAPEGKLAARLDAVMEDRGYADRAEVVDHLLERGLRAYGEPAEDPHALRDRLRGLGYIE